MNIPTILAAAVTGPITSSDFLWAVFITIIATLTFTLLFQNIIREYRKVTARITTPESTPNVDRVLGSSRPQIIVNVPNNFKAIAPLPGDTSVEGQRAVLFYSVFREALSELVGDSPYASSSDVESATEAAQAAVEACYGEAQA